MLQGSKSVQSEAKRASPVPQQIETAPMPATEGTATPLASQSYSHEPVMMPPALQQQHQPVYYTAPQTVAYSGPPQQAYYQQQQQQAAVPAHPYAPAAASVHPPAAVM